MFWRRKKDVDGEAPEVVEAPEPEDGESSIEVAPPEPPDSPAPAADPRGVFPPQRAAGLWTVRPPTGGWMH